MSGQASLPLTVGLSPYRMHHAFRALCQHSTACLLHTAQLNANAHYTTSLLIEKAKKCEWTC